MEAGNLRERVLARSVLKYAQQESVTRREGAAVGQDFSDIAGILSADGWHADPEIAYIKADNNFSCSGGTPCFVRFLALLTADTEEAYVRTAATKLEAVCNRDHVQIAGGHTTVEPSLDEPRFYVTICGMPGDYRQAADRICPGDAIVMAGDAGLLGTQLLLRRHAEELKRRFPAYYIEEAMRTPQAYRVRPAAAIAADTSDVLYMHDVSFGGVYTALWQMSVRIKKGIRIEHAHIPIRQETIEICEAFNCNPYMLEGTGALLFVTRDGEDLCSRLSDGGIEAAVIGRVTADQDKAIAVGADIRYLNHPSGDEIFNAERKHNYEK